MAKKPQFLNTKEAIIDFLNAMDLNLDYRSIDVKGLSKDTQGWGDQDEIFDYVFTHWWPKIILEVGTWKGASAIRMADLQRDMGIDGLIICIDTWLGSNESLWRVDDNRKMLMLQDGFPTIYKQFVANVVASGHHDRIRHLPMTSSAAAELLRLQDVQADAIYIDAGHQEHEVFSDMTDYWSILKPGGIFFGDDYSASWPGTVKAVNRFVADRGLKLRGTDWKWLIVKPENEI